jgi:hypothetical protein
VTFGAHNFARKFSCVHCFCGASGRLLFCGAGFPFKQLPQVGKFYLCEDVLFIYMNRNWSFSGQTNECDKFSFITSQISYHRSFIWLNQECGSLLQIRPPKFTHFNFIILQNSCMFLASLVHHQGVQLYKTIARICCPLQYLVVWWNHQSMMYGS